LIVKKIIEIVVTRSEILRLKCIKIDFGWACDPDPGGRAYSAPPDPVAGIKGSKGREGCPGRGRDDKKGKEGWGRHPRVYL